MAVKIKFDPQHNPIPPTFVLMTKGGTKLGALPASDITFRTSMREYSEISFNVYKSDCHNIEVWNKLVDFRLLWVREWNMLYELQIDLTESSETVKAVQARSLGESELSQINLHGVEINTENDIARDDYKPTVLYCNKEDEVLKEYDSLLDRISEKIPHYEIDEVDASIAGIQRTFTFDGISIYDAFQEIAEEIQCLFIIDCKIDEDTEKISRKIKVKDLLSHCNDCGERGDFIDKCSKCGETSITLGYGKDTAVFVSKDNLADEITYSTDCDKVKNCFRLEAGDDLMTATVANCNPNGSSYIWHFSDKMKEDMSTELQAALSDYDETYEKYRDSEILFSGFKDYNFEDYENGDIPYNLLGDYNVKVVKYNGLGAEQHEKIADPIKGYPQLMNAYYNVADFRLFLESGLMPSVKMAKTSTVSELGKLSGKTVAVQSVSLDSVTTVSSAVRQFAKTIVDNRYNVEIIGTPTLSKTTSESKRNWEGIIKVTNAADENDTISGKISMTVTDDIATYTQQRIDKLLEKKVTTSDSATDVKALFQKDDKGNFFYGDEGSFTGQIKKYSLSRLLAFHDACQACLDIMIEQGIAEKKETDKEDSIYNTLYLPYYNRLGWLAAEIKRREEDINVVKTTEERILQEQVKVQNKLDIETCLGSELWKELMSFRREGTYSNDNYISDGLTNEELFKNAQDFISVAENEIYKSSTLQHTISSSLKNLLFMKEFEPIVDNFEVGNWIRVKIDGKVYRLRLLEYEISFEEPENITVTFSDVTETKTGVSDIESILDQAASMASSYDAVARQSRVGKDAKKMLDGWVKDGLSLTNSKIINNADEQQVTMDNHGLLCREYLPITDEYDKKQLKIINRGLYLTDNSWKTARAGIGNFVYVDPTTNTTESAYGVIADTIIGKIILSEKVGIYNSNNSVSIDKNGFVITVPEEAPTESIFKIRHETEKNTYKDLFVVGTDGSLTINGYATNGDVEGQISASASSLRIEFNESITTSIDTAKGEIEEKYTSAIEQSAEVITAKVEGVQTNLNGVESELQSQITTNAQSISLKVSQTELEDEVKKQVESSITVTPSSIRLLSSSLMWDSKNSSLTEEGFLTVTGGSIGGFGISENEICFNMPTETTWIDMNNRFCWVPNNNTFCLHPNNTEGKNWYISGSKFQNPSMIIGKNFGIENDGTLHATNAIISGQITATGGEIGGFTIGKTSENIGYLLYGTAGGNGGFELKPQAYVSESNNPCVMRIGSKFKVRADGTLEASGISISYNDLSNKPTIPSSSDFVKVGNSYSGSGKAFSVSSTGYLEATGATINGDITATGGTIGGFTINQTEFKYYNGDLTYGWLPNENVFIMKPGVLPTINTENDFYGDITTDFVFMIGTTFAVQKGGFTFLGDCLLGGSAGFRFSNGRLRSSESKRDKGPGISICYDVFSPTAVSSLNVNYSGLFNTSNSGAAGSLTPECSHMYLSFYSIFQIGKKDENKNIIYMEGWRLGVGATSLTTKYMDDNVFCKYSSRTEVGIHFNTTNTTYSNFYVHDKLTNKTVFYVTNAGDIYNSSGSAVSSDARLKNTISNIDTRYESFFKKLRPVTYKLNDGESGRFHSGFIAQEVETALSESGLTTLDFAGFVRNTSEDTNFFDDGDLSLRYNEFVSLNTHMIQVALKENEDLKSRVSQLEETISKLTN